MLVAISIPVFTAQLDKAKLAAATANARGAVAEYVAGQLSDPKGNVTDAGVDAAVKGADLGECSAAASSGTVTVTSPKGRTNTFKYDTGSMEGDAVAGG